MSDIVRTIENDDYRLDISFDNDAENPLYAIETIGLHIFFDQAPDVLHQKIFSDYKSALEEFQKNEKIISIKHIYRNNNKFTIKDKKEDGAIGVVFITESSFLKFMGYAYDNSALHKHIIEGILLEELQNLTFYLDGECYGYRLYQNAETCDNNNTFKTCDMVDPVKRKMWNHIDSSNGFYGYTMSQNGVFESVKTMMSMVGSEEFCKMLID